MASLNNIAVLKISRKDAMAAFMSFDYLKATRSDPDGPLQKIIAWFKQEDAMNFDTKHMKLGRDADDFSVLYYFESKRWKIGKDGFAFVSGADADDMMENDEKDLQLLIDTILNAELTKAFCNAVEKDPKIKTGKIKTQDDGQGYYTRSLLGIQDV